MAFQHIGNDRYKIYLDRLPARSIRLNTNEIKEISEFNPEYLEQLEEASKIHTYYDDVLGDIEEQAGLVREAEEIIKKIKDTGVAEEMKDILEDIANQVSGHL